MILFSLRLAGFAGLLADLDADRFGAGVLVLWESSRGSRKVSEWCALIEACGNVPWPLMQASFGMLRPTLHAAKLVALLDRAWDDEFLDGFLATERWGNDNVSFPGGCYRDYIERLYRGNELVAGTITVHDYMSDDNCPY